MSITSCFFVVDKQAPTKNFLTAVLEKYPTVASCVIIKDDAMDILDPVQGASADDILELINEGDSLKHRMVFWCCKSDSAIAPEDMQPYSILVDGESKVCMAAFVEGDFISYLKTDSAFSPETFAINDYLRPKIELLCNTHSEETERDDFGSVYKDLENEEMQTEFFGAQRGAVVLMSPGAVETYRHKNTEIYEETGLWSSDPCGFGKPTEIKTSKFNRNKEKPVAVPSTTPSIAPSPASTPVVPGAEEPKGIWVRKGALVQSNMLAKEWYLELFGFDKASAIPKDTLEKVLLGEPLFLPQIRFEAIRARPIMKKTVVTSKPASSDRTKAPDTPSSGSAIPIPVMSDNTTKKVAEQFLKPGNLGKTLMDNADKNKLTVAQVQEVFQKHKDWYEQLSDKVKIDVDWSMTWPYEMYLDLSRTEPQNIAILAWDHACRLIKANAQVAELEAKLHKLDPPKPEGVRATTMEAPKTSKFNQKAG